MSEAERPRCPQCGTLLTAQGTPTRTLVTEHDQTIELSRSYATCPQCGAGLFPPG
jgi:ribosomal protein S27AE